MATSSSTELLRREVRALRKEVQELRGIVSDPDRFLTTHETLRHEQALREYAEGTAIPLSSFKRR